METNYSRQRLTLEGRQANWEVCFRTHTTLVKANTAQHTKSDQSDTATTQQPMMNFDYALTGLHHQVKSPHQEAQCLLKQRKGGQRKYEKPVNPSYRANNTHTHTYTHTHTHTHRHTHSQI